MTDSPFTIGLDLGQARDYTAIAVLERLGKGKATHYHLRHLERPPLGTSYPEVVTIVRSLLARAPLQGAKLVVDATGVGRPVVDLLRRERLMLTPVLITGGDTITFEKGFYRVPKRDLVGALQVHLQGGTLKVAESLPLASTLVAELLNFKVKVNIATAHDSYEAWREGDHDDLVLATALAVWWEERSGAWLKLPEPPGSRLYRGSY